MKQITFAVLFFLGALAVFAQNEYVFRFVPGRNAFYVPYNGNGIQLDSLEAEISKKMVPLQNGDCYISVSSYGKCSHKKLSHIRRQRVKSELIHRCGVSEDMFVTDRNVSSPYKDSLNNVVVVIIPAPVDRVKAIAGPEAAERVMRYNQCVGQFASEVEETEETAVPSAVLPSAMDAAEAEMQPESEEEAIDMVVLNTHERSCSFALRANLLRWATLTPDLGIELRIKRHMGIAINGSWTSWSWNDGNRRYAQWEAAPEVRYYIGKETRGYVGAIYKTGGFNYKLSSVGKEGNLTASGITGGYQLKLSNDFLMDFSLGLGYLHANYDRYTVIDGVRVREGRESKNRWGPISTGVILVWRIF